MNIEEFQTSVMNVKGSEIASTDNEFISI